MTTNATTKPLARAPAGQAPAASLPAFELVLPAFNEAQSLPSLVARAMTASEVHQLPPGAFRLIVVDNGSQDETVQVLAALEARYGASRLKSVRVPVNQGYGHGLWRGLQAATAPIVGWSHADAQCDPADALLAYQQVATSEQPLLVKGARRGRSRQERFVSRTFEACARVLLGMDVAEVNAQPKVMPKSLLTNFRSPPKDFTFDLYALYHAKKQRVAIHSIPVDFAPRAFGVSRWAANLGRRYKTIGRVVVTMATVACKEGRLG